MTPAQINNYLHILFGSSGALAALIIAKSGLTSSDYSLWLEAILPIASIAISVIWSKWQSRPAAQVLQVKALPEVATVVVKNAANGEIGEIAANPDHPDIVTEKQNAIDKTKTST